MMKSLQKVFMVVRTSLLAGFSAALLEIR
jgi:hypothetical protein